MKTDSLKSCLNHLPFKITEKIAEIGMPNVDTDCTRESKPRKWANLKQQTMPAWQPVFSPKLISPFFLGFALLLIPVGVVVILVSSNIQEIEIDYTDCIRQDDSTRISCAEFIKKRTDFNENCTCKVDFELADDYQGEIYIYYGLTNFYQNHRRYIQSRDDEQLLGRIGSADTPTAPSDSCEPFDKNADGKIIIPCGAIANSMFNDSFTLYDESNAALHTEVPLIRKGISWTSDRKFGFKNPEQFSNQSDQIWNSFVRPRDWSRWLWDLDPEDPENNGLQNEDLIVWMRPAALPSFRKLYRKVSGGLRKGNYSFSIKYDYEVKSFKGTKSIIVSETSNLLGGQNSFLGITIVTTGGIVMVLGLLFLLSFCRRKKSWKRTRTSVHKNYGTHSATSATSSQRSQLKRSKPRKHATD